MKWLRFILVSFLVAGLAPLCVLGYMAYQGVENDEARALEQAEAQAKRAIQQAEARFHERCVALIKQESARDFTEFQAWHAPLHLRAQGPSVVQSVLNGVESTDPFVAKYFQLTLRDDQLVYQTPHSENEIRLSANQFFDDEVLGGLSESDALVLRRVRKLAGVVPQKQAGSDLPKVGPGAESGSFPPTLNNPLGADEQQAVEALQKVYGDDNRIGDVLSKPTVDNDILATNSNWRKVRDLSDLQRMSRQANKVGESLNNWENLQAEANELDLYGRSQLEIYPYQRLAYGDADEMILFRYVITPYSKILQGMLVDLPSIQAHWQDELQQLSATAGVASNGLRYVESPKHLPLNPVDTAFEEQIRISFPKLELLAAPDTLGVSAQFSDIRRDYLFVAGAYVVLLGLLGFVLYQTIGRHSTLVQQQRDFVTAVSHELRTPLSSIRLQAEMLQNKPGVEEVESLKRGLSRIVQDEERLMRLIEMILTSTRIERKELELHMEEASPSLALMRAISQAASQYPQRTVELDDQSEGALTKVDQAVAEQLFYNLIDNALKYSKEERQPVHVLLSLKGDALLAEFRDQGCGIAQKELKGIFQRFYRGSRANEFGAGTGIGLWLCDTYAGMLGWKLYVKSSLGKGTCVSVEIPVL